jgi:hypothetical protein
MSAPIDCPICLRVVNRVVNRLTTNCGHCFHTSCLAKNIVSDGFSCPCCRNDVSGKPIQQEELAEPIIVKKIKFENRPFLIDKVNCDVYSYEAYTRDGDIITIGKWSEDTQTITFVE